MCSLHDTTILSVACHAADDTVAVAAVAAAPGHRHTRWKALLIDQSRKVIDFPFFDFAVTENGGVQEGAAKENGCNETYLLVVATLFGDYLHHVVCVCVSSQHRSSDVAVTF